MSVTASQVRIELRSVGDPPELFDIFVDGVWLGSRRVKDEAFMQALYFVYPPPPPVPQAEVTKRAMVFRLLHRLRQYHVT